MTDILSSLPRELQLEVIKLYSKYKVTKEIIKTDVNGNGESKFKNTYLIKNFVGHVLCYADSKYCYNCVNDCKFLKDQTIKKHLSGCYSNECKKYMEIQENLDINGFEIGYVYIKPRHDRENDYFYTICSVTYHNEEQLVFKNMWKIRTHSDDYDDNCVYDNVTQTVIGHEDILDLGNNNGTIFVNDDNLIDIMKDLGCNIDDIHKTMEKYKNKN